MKHRRSGMDRVMSALRFLPLLLLVVLTLLVLWKRDEITLESILLYTPSNHLLAAFFLLLLYAVKSLSVFFPIVILMAAGGRLFPLPSAFLLNLAGSALCVSIPFWVGRRSGKDFVSRRLERYEIIHKLNTLQRRNDLFFSYLTRILGVLPCDVVSLYLGSIGLPYSRYLLGSLLGLLPTLLAMTIAGASVTDPSSPAFLLSVSTTLLIALISSLLFYLFKRRHRM